MAAESSRLDRSRLTSRALHPDYGRCTSPPAVLLRAPARAGGAGPGGGALTPSPGTWPRSTPRRASPGGSSCCSHDKPALHPTVPPPRHAGARARRARVARRPAHARGGVPARPPSRAGLPAGVGRAGPAGRALLLHGRRLRAPPARRRERIRAAAQCIGTPRRRRPGRSAALLRRGRRLPRLRRGLGLRAERAAAARARRRRRGARAVPVRARRGRVRSRQADAAGRRAARLRPGRGRALRRPARPAARSG